MPEIAAAPLAGLRVLDLTRLLPGGYATQMLADLGAGVVKIEQPGVGDYSRTMPPPADGAGLGFVAVNRGKRSAAINLKAPGGRAALLRLVESADVLIESFRPGTLARLGLGYPLLRARNPRLVICALSGYGQHGPYRDRAGHDLNYIGVAGLLAHLRAPGQPPAPPGAQLADIAGGALMAVVGILAALVARGIAGQGCLVDVAMADGALALLPLLAATLLAGQPEPAPGEGWLAGGLPAYGVYAAADGEYVTLAALEPRFWEAFCRAIARPDLIARHIPRDAADRAALSAELAALFRTRTRAEWVALLADADACLGPVSSLREALADPQLRARGMVRPAEGDAVPALRITPQFDPPVPAPAGRVPALGEHTAAVLAEVGYSEAEIAALIAGGAVALAS